MNFDEAGLYKKPGEPSMETNVAVTRELWIISKLLMERRPGDWCAANVELFFQIHISLHQIHLLSCNKHTFNECGRLQNIFVFLRDLDLQTFWLRHFSLGKMNH